MKNTKKKKIFCILVAVSLMLLFSCKDSSDEKPIGSTDADDRNSGALDEPAENPLYIDDLPERDYGGETFKMMTWDVSFGNLELVVEEQTGDVIFDSIYLANRSVQDRFKIEFEQIYVDNYGNNTANIRRTVSTGDNAYDAAIVLASQAMELALEGKYFYTIDELPYVNLEKLYWDQQLKKDLTIDNVLYFTGGAHMLSICDLLNFLVYNKQLVTDLGLENIYDLVRDGNWTIDKMYEMAAAAASDLDGDSIMTEGDRWGVVQFSGQYYPSFWGAERLPLVAKDANDLPYFNVKGNEKFFRLFDKLYSYSQSGCEWNSRRNVNETTVTMFNKGQGLFLSSTMFSVQSLRGMDVDYGIVPYPTLDEKRPGEPYSARLTSIYPMIVPVTADAERASVIMEALANEYQRRVIPNYYELAVQIKSTRDEESLEILEMLMANRFMDFGDALWTYETRVKYTDIFDLTKGNILQSETEKIADVMDMTIEKAIEAFRNAGG